MPSNEKPAARASRRASESVLAGERDNQTYTKSIPGNQAGTIEIYSGRDYSGRTYPARGYWYARAADDQMLGGFPSQVDATAAVYRAANRAAIDAVMADGNRPRSRS